MIASAMIYSAEEKFILSDIRKNFSFLWGSLQEF